MPNTIYDWLATIGGIGVIILGIFKFIGDLLKSKFQENEKRRTEIERAKTQYSLDLARIPTERFYNSQYDVYLQLWESLQGLRLTVEALWGRATKQNVLALSRQIGNTKRKVMEWSLFFEDEDYKDVIKVLNTLDAFRLGKVYLVNLRDHLDDSFRSELILSAMDIDLSGESAILSPQINDPDEIVSEISRQINANGELKEQFDTLLDRIRQNFQSKMNTVKVLK